MWSRPSALQASRSWITASPSSSFSGDKRCANDAQLPIEHLYIRSTTRLSNAWSMTCSSGRLLGGVFLIHWAAAWMVLKDRRRHSHHHRGDCGTQLNDRDNRQGSIFAEDSPRDIGSILILGNGDNGKSQGVSGCAAGASRMSTGAGGIFGSSTPCIRPR